MIISDNQLVILGPPGCGKTTSLLTLVEQCFESGIAPHQVAFVSFSRRATQEALDRACAKFGFLRGQLPFFRTLHSLTFHQLGLHSSEIMTGADYNKLGDILRAPFTQFGKTEEVEQVAELWSEKKGDVMLFLDSLARARMQSVEETYHTEHNYKLTKHEFIRFCETYKLYRSTHNLLDFTDMLDLYVRTGSPVNVRVAFIDEAQDLSKLQWEACKTAFANCERVVIAGDDDQAIFKWAGADAESFLSLGGTKMVLNKSYRLPQKVYEFSQRIITPVKHRYIKDFMPREDGGYIKRFREAQHVPLTHDSSWLWLARNSSALPDIERILRAKHVIYQNRFGCSVKPEHVRAIIAWEALRAGKSILPTEYQCCLDYIKGSKKLNKSQLQSKTPVQEAVTEIWHDALTGISIEQREYYLSILRRGGKLTDKPLHTVSTIHGSKGMEADNVVLLSAMGKNTHDAYMRNDEDERRVFYVGATRAKHNLFIVDNQAPRSFKIPFFD